MRISYEWLKTMVDVPEDPSKLVDEFVRTGTEVEAVERVGADLDHVVTAQVVSKKPHPDSDHMFVCLVDVGEKNLGADGKPEPLQIVCGAQNFNEGDHIVTAMIGAVLPGDVKIKKSKLRGVVSMGMNCSERELGLGNDHDGIMILPPDAPVGMDFTDYRGMSDTVIDCEITPNRPDCLSMCGMAVEVAAMLDEDTHIELPRVQSECGPDAHDLVDVAIDDPELCQRYTARVVRNVKIGPSPEWLARRVIAAGSRPINNVVDVTNYVMYLTGQPLHAFDLGKLTERDGKRHIVVRAAADGEQLETLDGVERTLTPDMAVITDDGKTPVALAGVMGGMNSEIDEHTTDVLLESATFSSGHVSRTSRNLDLMSEASIRYERQVDGANCANVAEIAAAAGVSKQTFYHHFSDKYHLMEYCFRDMFAAPFERMGTLAPFDECYIEFLQLCHERKTFLRNAFTSQDVNSLYRVMHHALRDAYGARVRVFGVLDQEETGFCLDFFSKGCAGCTRYWFDQGMDFEDAELVGLIRECIPVGVARFFE